MAGTELGKAYVQIVPSAKGISDGIKGVLGGAEEEGKKVGEKLGAGIATGLKTAGKVIGAGLAAATAGVVALGKQSIEEFANYEQLVGGAQLMFGDAYDYVAERAASAYKNVQMSQNDYLQQVNGFATGLKTALGGNERLAAELADKIITAEADVVAATGNSQEAVQNAFNGIMKSNYTMLDNLQLGITPTKEGFQEVIDKVNEWNKANGKATNYQIDNLADAQSALVDYIDMVGVSGYANEEAAKTIQGSVASMKSAWKNLVVGIADENADFDSLVAGFTDSVSTVAANILPRIGVALKGVGKLVVGLAPVITEAIPMLVQDVLPPLLESASGLLMSVANALVEYLPMILNVALQVTMALADGLIENLPVLIPAIVNVIMVIAEKLTDPETVAILLNAAFMVAGAVIEGLIAALPNMMSGLSAIGENLLAILQIATEPVIEWVEGVWGEITGWFDENVIQPIAGFFTDLWNGIVSAFDTIIGPWLEIARRAFSIFDEKIIRPIKNAFSDLWRGIVSVASSAWASVKQVFAPVANWFRDIFSRAWQAVKNVFSTGGRIFNGIKEGIASVFKNVVNHIIAGINTVISVPFNAINGFLNTLRNVSILGVRPFGWIQNFGVPQIPKLAKGGIVDDPTLIEAGEGDSAEAIIPLDKLWREMRSMWSDTVSGSGVGIRNMTFNIYATEGQDVNDIADAVMERIQDVTDMRGAALA